MKVEHTFLKCKLLRRGSSVRIASESLKGLIIQELSILFFLSKESRISCKQLEGHPENGGRLKSWGMCFIHFRTRFELIHCIGV
nr:MAG TPA: hypothetical protein [Caudoviricetes sp.]